VSAEDLDEIEDVEGFRQRARSWIRENLRLIGPVVVSLRSDRTDDEERAEVARDREVQRMLFDAGLAGICMPREYGGRGLTPAHQKALNEELAGYEFPVRMQAPTFTPCAAVLLDFGTEEQKQRHIPAILKGEEIWMQFLSEPSGGSDVAGALTTAVRDGDEWVLNGSKVWTTGAWWSDWGLCLARTNWDVPKHRGLTVFMLPIDRAGIEVHRIEMLNGNREFCQEFLSDVRVPDHDRIGEVDDGWTVGTRWMFHERMLYNSPYATIPTGTVHGTGGASMLDVARDAGRLQDPTARDLVGRARMLDAVGDALKRRVGQGIASGTMSEQASAVARLFAGYAISRRVTIAFELAGGDGAAWTDDDGETAGCGNDFLMRQVGSIGGGTTEMARNVVSERVLGMPRERSGDRDVPFRDVPRGPT
jgi:alkylation response protein AidB-like acyl-CoA dehydrogenase